MNRRNSAGPAVAGVALLALTGCQYFPSPPPGWEGDFTVGNVLTRADLALVEQDERSPDEPESKEEAELRRNPEPAPPRFMDASDMVASIRMARVGEEARDMLLKWRRGGEWSLSLADGAESVRYVGAGVTAVELRNGVVTRDDVSLDEVGVRHLLRCLFVVSFFQSGPGTQPEIIAPVELPDGRHVVNVRKYDERGLGWVLSLDSETVRPARLREWVLIAEDEGVPRDTYFRQFAADPKGRLYPEVLQTYDGSAMVQETVIRDLGFDKGLTKSDFLIPRG